MKYLKKIFLLWGILTFPLYNFAQLIEDEAAYTTATITEDYCVSLDADAPIAEYYSIDISHLHLATEKDANDRFGYICNNLLTYSVDFEASKAYLQIHLDRTPEPKDITWWSDYINSLCGL